MPYADVPGFLKRMRETDLGEATKLAFEFLILTASRTAEALEARWSEINLDDAVWTIPAARMKAGREHRAPLAQRAVDVLRRAKALAGASEFVFSGRSADRPLSNMVFLMALRRMGVGTTAHGFRSSFRDWAAERTNTPREVAEMALAHTIKDKVEAAYRRGDLFEKRRQLMQAWATYLSGHAGEVLQLRPRSKSN